MPFFRVTDIQRPRYEFANALSLNGTNQQGTVQNISGVAVPSSWTALIFVKLTAVPGTSAQVTLWGNYQSSSPLHYFDVRLTGAAGGFYTVEAYSVLSGVATKLPGPANISGTGRLLITVTRRANGQMFTSMNGVAGAVTTPSTTPAFTSFGTVRLGSSGGGAWLNGIIAELDFFPQPLEMEDIRRIWNGGRGSYFRDRELSAVQSVFRFKMDETSGSTAYDSSGQTPSTPRNLTLLNSPSFVSTF